MIDVPTIEFYSFKETVTAENSSLATFSDHNTILSQEFDYKIPAEIQQISRSALKLAGSAQARATLRCALCYNELDAVWSVGAAAYYMSPT